MGNNILVIGNGFDLMHERKTKYSHFLEFLKSISSENSEYEETIISKAQRIYPLFKDSDLVHYFIKQYEINRVAGNWIDMERDLKVLIKTFLGFIEFEASDYYRDEELVGVFRYDELPVCYRNLLSLLKNYNESKSELGFIFKKKYIDFFGHINKDKVLSELTKELKGIAKLLEYYLSEIEPGIRGCDLNKVKLIEDIDPAIIISFNYTDTFEMVYGKQDRGVTYVHGKLNEGNIVLGYDDDGTGTDDLAFKKYYQRLIYRTENELSLNEFIKGIARGFHIHFVGHSLDVSDKDILRILINGENSVHIHCRNEKEMNERTANIIKVIGKEKTIAGMARGTISFEISIEDKENIDE